MKQITKLQGISILTKIYKKYAKIQKEKCSLQDNTNSKNEIFSIIAHCAILWLDVCNFFVACVLFASIITKHSHISLSLSLSLSLTLLEFTITAFKVYCFFFVIRNMKLYWLNNCLVVVSTNANFESSTWNATIFIPQIKFIAMHSLFYSHDRIWILSIPIWILSFWVDLISLDFEIFALNLKIFWFWLLFLLFSWFFI